LRRILLLASEIISYLGTILSLLLLARALGKGGYVEGGEINVALAKALGKGGFPSSGEITLTRKITILGFRVIAQASIT